MTLGFLSSEAGDGVGAGGDVVSFGATFVGGVGGKGLLVGCGGTVRMNDLKDRTGLSIPSSDGDEMLSCLSGDGMWPCRVRFMPTSCDRMSRRKGQHTASFGLLEDFREQRTEG
jgi:hypothetical protein